MIPPPPTPPIIPPYREATSTAPPSDSHLANGKQLDTVHTQVNRTYLHLCLISLPVSGAEEEESEEESEVVAVKPTEIFSITRVVKVIQYENVTHLITNSQSVKEQGERKFTFSMSIPIIAGLYLVLKTDCRWW